MLFACVLIPRFGLIAAAGGRRELLRRPVALAPGPGEPQVIGDVSGPAEAFGITPGMRLAEALARCPGLALIPPDPQRADEEWERLLARLEAMGAAVEPGLVAGEAFFGLDGLRGVLGEPRRALERVRHGLGRSVRLGAGPTRLCALAAARSFRPRRGGGTIPVVGERSTRRYLAPLPIGLLRHRLGDEWTGARLTDTLERLGVRTLGELAELPDSAVADRFGEPGLQALRLARGIEPPLRPRTPPEELREEIDLPDAASGQHLERALELLLDRLLASPARRGRSLRRLRLEARLASGGGWRIETALRSASADRERLLLALRPKLASLPAPAARLGLRALELGDPAPEQIALTPDDRTRRRGRLAEAVRQARAAAGRGAVLRVLDVDPGSALPERKATLTPFEPPEP